MAVSASKKAAMARAKREKRVLDRSITGRLDTPFMDANQDARAREYIETGDASLLDRMWDAREYRKKD